MKISALFFIVLLTFAVVLPSSIGARDLLETESVVQPQAGSVSATGSSNRRAIPCGRGSPYYSCFPRGRSTKCSTFSRSCPP